MHATRLFHQEQAGHMQKSNYELFNCNNFNIRYWSWNYRGCWPLFKYSITLSYRAVSSISSRDCSPSCTLCYRTPCKSTISGGLARTLSHRSDPHLSARYDGQTLLCLATGLTCRSEAFPVPGCVAAVERRASCCPVTVA